MPTKIAAAIALTLVVITGVLAQPAEVELANPSFEEGTAENGIPIGWAPYGTPAGDSSVSVRELPDGTRALLLQDTSPAGEVGVYQDFPVEAGVGYRVTASVLRVDDESPGGSWLQFRFLPGDSYRQVGLAAQSPDEPNDIAIFSVAPEGATTGRIYLYTHAEPTPKVMVSAVSVEAGAEPPVFPEGPAPDPVPPQYDTLKDLHLITAIVAGGQPAAVIVRPASGEHDAQAEAIRAAIAEITGVTVPIVTDTDPAAALPPQTNLIVLGSRDWNATIEGLYEGFFTLVDARYPGPGGWVVRSIHNPYGDGHNVIIAGASEPAQVALATDALIGMLHAASAGQGELSVGWLREIHLSDRYEVPRAPEEMEIWEASRTYGSSGYFGWNIISKHMAAYYETGDQYHAREFLRLSFPDEAAIAEIERLDGERIENKHDPLAGPYHYSAHMMVMFWDLIEEDPFFTDEQRLRITNALSRQLTHRAVEGVYGSANPPGSVGNRHGDWSAMSLYALARYFERDYGGPIWEAALRSSEIYFSGIERSAWLAGNNDHLFWYTSYYDPILDYMHLSGYRGGMDNLKQALRTQDILFTGTADDWGLRASSLNFLHRAADITGDGRFVFYRQRTGLDTDVFRLGQSWWPTHIPPREPTELQGTWTLQPMPEPMWRGRGSGIPLEQQFLWGTWRNTLDDGGDLVMIKGHNGGGRLPYHTFSIMEQRLAGRTLLKGYRTQVLTSADGMVAPIVAMDSGLVDHGTLGDTLYAIGDVPRMAFADWQRSFIQREGRYALFVDDLAFSTNSDNVKVETEWNTVGGSWNARRNVLAIQGSGPASERAGWVERRALDADIICGPGTPAELLSDLDSIDIVLLKAAEPGTWIEMPFTLDEPITGQVYADLLDYTDRGIVRISLDGEVLAENVDHSAAAATRRLVDLGERTLAAGEHALRVEVTAGRPESERMYVGLVGVAIRPEGVPDAQPQVFELHSSDVLRAEGGGMVVMQWLGTAAEGQHRIFFHLLAHRDADAPDALACYRIADHAAALALPEPALAVRGEFEDTTADLAVLASDHLFARGLTASPLASATAPVTVDWDFATGALAASADAPATLAVRTADGEREIALAPGEPVSIDATPDGAVLTDLGQRLAGHLTRGRTERERQLAAAREPTPIGTPEIASTMAAQVAGAPVAALTIARDGGDLTAIAEGTTVHLLAADGSSAGTMQTDGAIRVIAWWPEHELLLAGCEDEQVIAFGLDGQRRWSFVSEMDQAVWEAGKQYWFKSAYPGIHGLATGAFMGGESQAFVGSACTLEILDGDGQLVRRMPIFWGNGWKFQLIDGPGNARRLLVARWPNGTDTLAVVNSETLSETKSFYGVPEGHTMVGGWTQQNRTGIIYADMDGDRTPELVTATNGIWNRVTVFNDQGAPLFNAQFGPGPSNRPYETMRDLEVADLDGDGDREIIVAISEGLVVALDHECRKVWATRLPSPPTQLEAITPPGADLPVILAGCEDGTVVRLTGSGEIVALGSAGGRVATMTVASTPAGPLAVVATSDGAVTGWRVD